MCACVPACQSIGTSIGTPKPVRAHLGSTASAVSGGGYSSSYRETASHVRSGSGSVTDGGPMLSPASIQSYHYEGGGGVGSSSTADYDLATGIAKKQRPYHHSLLFPLSHLDHAVIFLFLFCFFVFCFWLGGGVCGGSVVLHMNSHYHH